VNQFSSQFSKLLGVKKLGVEIGGQNFGERTLLPAKTQTNLFQKINTSDKYPAKAYIAFGPQFAQSKFQPIMCSLPLPRSREVDCSQLGECKGGVQPYHWRPIKLLFKTRGGPAGTLPRGVGGTPPTPGRRT